MIRPTFDDREGDDGVALGALILHQASENGGDYTQVTPDDFPQLARDADFYARTVFHSAGYPFLFDHRLHSLALLQQESFERRELPVVDFGEVDTDVDRFREIHRWSKQHGFVGGFPTFVDGEQNGVRTYGAVLIKPGSAEEVFLSAAEVWQDAVSAKSLRVLREATGAERAGGRSSYVACWILGTFYDAESSCFSWCCAKVRWKC